MQIYTSYKHYITITCTMEQFLTYTWEDTSRNNEIPIDLIIIWLC